MTVQAYFSRLLHTQRGNVVILVALMMFVLILSIGVAVDMARAQILHQRISSALDAAGLAALQSAGSPPTGYTTATWAEHEAERYFNANFPAGYLGATAIVCCNSTFVGGGGTLNLSVTGTQPTVFMQTVGIYSVNVGATSQVKHQGLEVVLALDTTGSMNAPLYGTYTKANALETSMYSFLDIIYGGSCYPFIGGNCPASPGLYIGVVPFAQSVNIPPSLQNSSFMDPSDPNIGNFGPSLAGANWYTPPGLAPGPWNGCVTSRSSTTPSSIDPAVTVNGTSVNVTLDVSEDPPSTAPFDEYFWSPVTPSYSYTPYAAYNIPTSAAPMTATGSGYMNINPWGRGPNGNSPPTQYVKYNTGTGNYDLTPVNDYTTFDGHYNNAIGDYMGPNTYCTHVPILPLQHNLANVYQEVYNINYGGQVGDTDISLGLAWAWRLLSPHWRGLWNEPTMLTNNLPLDYHTVDSEKVLILETDGTNFQQPGVYSAYGFFPSGGDPETVAGDLDTRTLAACQSLKNNGVIIYTIGFGSPATNNPPSLADRQNNTLVDVPLLQACATTPAYFYLAPDEATLTSAFQSIANSLQIIHVSK